MPPWSAEVNAQIFGSQRFFREITEFSALIRAKK